MKKGVWNCLFMHQVFSLAISVLLIVFRTQLFGIFTQDADVVRIGAQLMAVIAPCYVVFSFIEIFSGALRAVGDVIIPMLLTMFGICVFRIAWIFLAVPKSPSLQTIVMNYPVSWICTAGLFILYYLRKTRSWGAAGQGHR